jgi:hypothetical protein
MVSFTIILHIYNSPLALVVTPLAMAPYSFLVKTINDTGNSMIIKRLPGKGWVGEMVKMKFFTKKNIQRLGKLLETKEKEILLLEKP